ncbi:hypothetical protein BJ508DRAFT_326814 [Ascobolus immersus RN42]|uniref:Uncharacterized protein n=1 Tax=Ascobolus immersus RN42 TaxID=1160509 RepID=A0A3N4I4D9_ASCIM|nr:hypothetical protein BJ508DRAFT_326814 [Ascobolus immersus RN42]
MGMGEEGLIDDRYPKDYDYADVVARLNAHYAYVVDVVVGDVMGGRSKASHAVMMSLENRSLQECGRVLLVMERFVKEVWRGVQVLTEVGEVRGREWGDEAVELFIELQVELFCGEEEERGALRRLSVWRGQSEGLVWSLVYAGAYARGSQGGRVLVVRTPEPQMGGQGGEEEGILDLDGVEENVWGGEPEAVEESQGEGRTLMEGTQWAGWEPISLFTQEG